MTATERDLEIRFSWLSAVAVALFGAALTIGLVAHVVTPGGTLATRMLQVGLLLLMGAPVVRLLLAFAERLRRRDWAFVAMTVAVAVELAIVMWRAAQKS